MTNPQQPTAGGEVMSNAKNTIEENKKLSNFPYFIYGVVYEDTLEPVGDKYMGITKEAAIQLKEYVCAGPLKNRGALVMEWRFTNDI